MPLTRVAAISLALAALGGCARPVVRDPEAEGLESCLAEVHAFEALVREHQACESDADCACIDTRWLIGAQCFYAARAGFREGEAVRARLLSARHECGAALRRCPGECATRCTDHRCEAR